MEHELCLLGRVGNILICYWDWRDIGKGQISGDIVGELVNPEGKGKRPFRCIGNTGGQDLPVVLLIAVGILIRKIFQIGIKAKSC